MRRFASPERLRLVWALTRGFANFRRGERGSGLVETALCFPILAALLFGLMMASMLLFSYHLISEAAREGTRYAIVRGSACKSWTTACPASDTDIQTYIRGLGYPSINPSAITVNTTWPNGNSRGNTVQVQVNYPFTLSIPFVQSRTINMTSTSVMVISQ
jgi:Flp pilus assembly protein TadG